MTSKRVLEAKNVLEDSTSDLNATIVFDSRSHIIYWCVVAYMQGRIQGGPLGHGTPFGSPGL